MTQQPSREELVANANKPAEDALKLHAFFRGKMQSMPRCRIRNYADLAIYYSPGVEAPCLAIKKEESLVNQYTGRWNTIAVISDGTRVLGLGDIGPKAGYPVMEGKCMLFKYLGGVDAVPICLGTKDADEIIRAVKWLQPSFAAINLEDIASPKCFRVLDELRQEAEIPIFHDDQQGTATVILSGLVNALRLVGKKIESARIVLNGAGAANVACARLMLAMGANPATMVVVDSKGILHPGRTDIEAEKNLYYYKWQFCTDTNAEGRSGNLAEALRGADVLVSLAKSGPGVISQEEIAGMASDAICFVCANPTPEIWPWEAKEAGARIVATGRSDFPNQVNNSIVFPALFRGVLDVQARSITDEMCIAAATALADYAVEKGINDDYILPTMEETEAFIREAVAVGLKAQEQGIARVALSAEQLEEKARTMIKGATESHDALVKAGCIPTAPV